MSNKIEDIRSNIYKSQVRENVTTQTILFAEKLNLSDATVLSLPAFWDWEKMLQQKSEEAALQFSFVGVENGVDEKGQKLYSKVKAIKPNGMNVIDVIEDDFDTVVGKTDCSVVWADYCGNPAEVKQSKISGLYYYSYPHIDAFVNKVAEGKPLIYFMTFSCNGRIQGGRDALQGSMGGKSMPSAIRKKIRHMLSGKGLSEKVQDVLRIYYHGGKRSKMITIGFVANVDFKMPMIKLDLMKDYIQSKNIQKMIDATPVKKTSALPLDIKVIRTNAIKVLSDSGITNNLISTLLNLSRNQVGAVLAHHKNPNSFKKNKIPA